MVAVEDQKIVGAILCGHDGRRGCMYHVCVHEDYRMQGIGKSYGDGQSHGGPAGKRGSVKFP